MAVANMKGLDAAHHRWQRRGYWESPGETKYEMRRWDREQAWKHILRWSGLQWLGHWMANNSIPKQALTWFPENGKITRWTGRPEKSWSDTLTEHLQNIDMTWDDFGEMIDHVSPNVLLYVAGLKGLGIIAASKFTVDSLTSSMHQ